MKNKASYLGRTVLVCGFIFLTQTAWAADENVDTSVAYTVLSDSAGVDSSQAVLNPNLKFRKKVRLDLESGVLGDELIANANYTLVRLAYYAQDDLSYGIGFRARTGGLAQESKDLQTKYPQLDFSRAPKATTAGFFSLGYNLCYGKLGLSGSRSINTTTQINADAGLQAYSDAQRPLVQLGITQLFFMGSRIAIGLNLGLSVAEVTDATSTSLDSSLPIPSNDQFSSKIQTGKFFGLNLNVLL